ncbi:IclR family transcriptional regulator [Acetobacteraceae bacterium H6797]|nr:IclR family transcriptional regulator [Acetobacteraceae bacterium H6797]
MSDATAAPPRRRGRPPLARAEGEAAEMRVEAVERALTILEAFGDGAARLTLSELAQRSGLYPSTILRLAASLDRFGYLHRGADGCFRLGPTPLRLGLRYRDAFDLADYVRPVLAGLVERLGETAAFYIRDGERRICLYRHVSSRLIRHHVEEGAALPLDRGASAHVLRAFTGGQDAVCEAVRAEGHRVSLGERDSETAAIAAPVFGRGGFLGALGIVGPLARVRQGSQGDWPARIMEEAATLSRTLGG